MVVPHPVRVILGKLSELGCLYKKVKTYVSAHEDNTNIGIVGQASFYQFYPSQAFSKKKQRFQ